MSSTPKVLVIALIAGSLGLLASLWTAGFTPLLHSALGQRVLGAMLAARAPKAPAGITVARPGLAIPPLQLRDLDGRIVPLPLAHAKHAVLINLWASWCGPCVREMPYLERFSSQQADNGVQVLGIALDDPTAVRAFLRQVPVTYPILTDAPGPGDAGVRLGNPAGVLPYSVLVSAEGVLLKQHIGPFAAGELENWVEP
ncbi:MAG: alkyl hydroperoxide reductase [Xanthomonadaceae bacterium]|nr:alkyl hydroperoxide reductase [Xanthomonadaceae bacterium]